MRKNIFILLFFVLYFSFSSTGQVKSTYEARWNEVNELLEKKELPKSALEKVIGIYELAKKDKNEAEQLKALIFRINIQQFINDENKIESIQLLEKETIDAKEPMKSILHSITADAYNQYLQENIWTIYQRKETEKKESGPIDTWGVKDFHKKINSHYSSSVSEYRLLTTISVDYLNVVLTKGNSRTLRPTLYDLLAHRALEYYEDESRQVAAEQDPFQLTSEIFYADADLFAAYKFDQEDDNSVLLKTIIQYQHLTELHLNGKRTEALIDIELKRLAFADRYSQHPDKKSLYEFALKKLIKNYEQVADVSEAAYLLAMCYTKEAAEYNIKKHPVADSSSPRWKYRKAHEILAPFIASKENTPGVSMCKNLFNSIKEQSLQFEAEEGNVPDKPFRILVQYKNVPKVWVRIIPITRTQLNVFNENSWLDENWRTITSYQAINTFSVNLPSIDDFQPHSTEISIPALRTGRYAILLSSSENFSTAADVMALQFLHVSNLVWLMKDEKLYILDRENGSPVNNASVQVVNQSYSYEKGKYEVTRDHIYYTSKDGSVDLVKNNKDDYNQLLEVSLGTDTLDMFSSSHLYVWNPFNTSESQAGPYKNLIFTDRAVYRPGQTIFFKGIITSQDKKSLQTKTANQLPVVLYLYNDAQDVIDSIQTTTNEFGSYSGSFSIPSKLLNGNYYIREKNAEGSHDLLVEEYKRPKFYVQLQAPKNTYKVDELIQLKGQVNTYSGYGLSNSTIRYRVIRTPILPYPWLCYRWGWPVISEEEIFSGTTRADNKGNFEISFKATPDLKVRKELNAVFNYEIITEATDISGETQNSKTNLAAGYQSVILQLTPPGNGYIAADSLKHIYAGTYNMMQVFEPRSVKLNIYKLRMPDRLIRKRYWEQPDQYVLSENEFLKLFPFDEYKNETEIETWQKTEMVYEKIQTTSLNKPFDLKNNSFKPGWYIAEAVTYDNDSTPIKQVVYFEIRKSIHAPSSAPSWLWHSTASTERNARDIVELKMGSDAENIFLIKNIWDAKSNEITWKTEYIKKEKTDKITLGGEPNNLLGYTYTFIKNNRQYSYTQNFEIKEKNKDLQITIESFRDKTSPGSDEEWRVHIENKNQKKEKTEIVTSLYDASLDVFRSNDWQLPNFIAYSKTEPLWQSSGFGTVSSFYKSFKPEEYFYVEKTYDQLPGVSLHTYYLRMAADMAVDSVAHTGAAKTKSSKPEKSEETRISDVKGKPEKDQTYIRKDFRETAFFFPQLYPDSSGKLTIKFKMPDALTRWKWQIFAHSQNMATGLLSRETTTSKELMTEPNIPRFLREGDQLYLAVRVSNTSSTSLTGQCKLELFNQGGKNATDGWFQNLFPVQYFTVDPGNNQLIRFPIRVPYQFNDLLTYRITASAIGNKNIKYVDGEEGVIPVLPNEVLLTETLPVFMHAGEEKKIEWEKLKSSESSETIHHKTLTVEFTANPIWSAVKSLPYIASANYQSADQIWNQFYANTLASHILKTNPKIADVIRTWETKDSSALLSQLEKNQELKSILLNETPWLSAAENERIQYQQLKNLFDDRLIKSEQKKAIATLKSYQAPTGGFVWFKGGQEDRYMTQYILTGIGQLLKINAIDLEMTAELNPLIENGLDFLDRRLMADYELLRKNKSDKKSYKPGLLETEQLYMRSFFDDFPFQGDTEKAYKFYYKCAKRNWVKQPIYTNALMLMILNRQGDVKSAKKIISSVKEKAVTDQEKGIFFPRKINLYSYQSGEEIQSFMIEAFTELNEDAAFIEGMKTWLLQQKRAQQWSCNKSTARACYALLLSGKPWHEQNNHIVVTLGDTTISSNKSDQEVGTGYFKEVLNDKSISPKMGDINIVTGNKDAVATPIWGGFYWQYLEKIENITNSSSTLSVSREFFLEKIINDKTVLINISDSSKLNIGDKILVRWTIKNDRMLEYVSLKDLRAACLEPVDKTSSYKWKDGVGYYESIRDSGTDLFFYSLPAGTFMIESGFYVSHSGTFSMGYANVQCLYAPEISSNSEGGKIEVGISE